MMKLWMYVTSPKVVTAEVKQPKIKPRSCEGYGAFSLAKSFTDSTNIGNACRSSFQCSLTMSKIVFFYYSKDMQLHLE